ncbi:basic proline-rich protein-like [Lutra lutra]|uniref:basic proline-rich protein-like n=1 Tax=Lutra lutra TaxID=9657 RepID=UPI001FD3101A|nr:basic proline-rich protein-like [Lutra lutra]
MGVCGDKTRLTVLGCRLLNAGGQRVPLRTTGQQKKKTFSMVTTPAHTLPKASARTVYGAGLKCGEKPVPRVSKATHGPARPTPPRQPPPPSGGETPSQETGSEPAAPLGLGGRLGSTRALGTRSRVGVRTRLRIPRATDEALPSPPPQHERDSLRRSLRTPPSPLPPAAAASSSLRSELARAGALRGPGAAEGARAAPPPPPPPVRQGPGLYFERSAIFTSSSPSHSAASPTAQPGRRRRRYKQLEARTTERTAPRGAESAADPRRPGRTPASPRGRPAPRPSPRSRARALVLTTRPKPAAVRFRKRILSHVAVPASQVPPVRPSEDGTGARKTRPLGQSEWPRTRARRASPGSARRAVAPEGHQGAHRPRKPHDARPDVRQDPSRSCLLGVGSSGHAEPPALQPRPASPPATAARGFTAEHRPPRSSGPAGVRGARWPPDRPPHPLPLRSDELVREPAAARRPRPLRPAGPLPPSPASRGPRSPSLQTSLRPRQPAPPHPDCCLPLLGQAQAGPPPAPVHLGDITTLSRGLREENGRTRRRDHTKGGGRRGGGQRGKQALERNDTAAEPVPRNPGRQSASRATQGACQQPPEPFLPPAARGGRPGQGRPCRVTAAHPGAGGKRPGREAPPAPCGPRRRRGGPQPAGSRSSPRPAGPGSRRGGPAPSARATTRSGGPASPSRPPRGPHPQG